MTEQNRQQAQNIPARPDDSMPEEQARWDEQYGLSDEGEQTQPGQSQRSGKGKGQSQNQGTPRVTGE